MCLRQRLRELACCVAGRAGGALDPCLSPSAELQGEVCVCCLPPDWFAPPRRALVGVGRPLVAEGLVGSSAAAEGGDLL